MASTRKLSNTAIPRIRQGRRQSIAPCTGGGVRKGTENSANPGCQHGSPRRARFFLERPVKAPALFAVAGPSSLCHLFFLSSVTSLTPLPAPLLYCLSESLARHRRSAPDRSMAAPWRRMPRSYQPRPWLGGSPSGEEAPARRGRGARDTARSSAGGHPCHYRVLP
jgi:hypothetical protein